MSVRLAASLMVLLMFAGCGRSGPPTDEPLRVAAASDLQAALPALTEGFREQTGRTVEFVVGSSANLALQIRQGAPFDVFLSADRARVEALAAEGLVPSDSVRPYAVGSLVLVVHRGSKVEVKALADLVRPEVKHVAIANPEFAPYGVAARQALESADIWEALGPKLVMGETVRQALQFVQSGNAEAGLVGRAIADVPEVAVVPIEPEAHAPIVQALGIVAESKQQDAARAFAGFLLGPAGQGILARYGFKPPPGAPD
jgi:molybdate transport system substrate-binding protein